MFLLILEAQATWNIWGDKQPISPLSEGPYAGHYIGIDKTGSYTEAHTLKPIPLYEMNINPDLQQNTGY